MRSLTLLIIPMVCSLGACTKDKPAASEPVDRPAVGASGERGPQEPAIPPPSYEEPDVTVTVPDDDATTDDDATFGEGYDADDSARNAGDADDSAKTPLDQSNDKPDIAITASIRQGIVDREEMSMNAKNVKIITEDGRVTLRGPVESEDERDFIDALARGTQGVKSVDDQLTVVTP